MLGMLGAAARRGLRRATMLIRHRFGRAAPARAAAPADTQRQQNQYSPCPPAPFSSRPLRGPRAAIAAGANSGWKKGAVRMMRTSSLSMRTFRPIAVGILRAELEQRRLIAELYLLSGLVNVHDLVDDLEQRLAVVNLAVMHFLWLAPAAIKQNLGRCNACHRWAIRFHHDTGQRFDGRVGV